MEIVDRSILRNYLPVKVFLDDLETIGRILEESCSGVSFEAEGFRFCSIGELVSKVKKLRLEAIHLKADSPYVTIELTRVSAKLYVGSSQDKSAGIFYKLDQLLVSRGRSLQWLYSHPCMWILNGCVWILNGVILLTNLIPQDYRLISFLPCVVMGAWVSWAAFIRCTRHSTIILTHKQARGSFVERNRDSLAVATISAVFGALAGVAGTVLMGYLTK